MKPTICFCSLSSSPERKRVSEMSRIWTAQVLTCYCNPTNNSFTSMARFEEEVVWVPHVQNFIVASLQFRKVFRKNFAYCVPRTTKVPTPLRLLQQLLRLHALSNSGSSVPRVARGRVNGGGSKASPVSVHSSCRPSFDLRQQHRFYPLSLSLCLSILPFGFHISFSSQITSTVCSFDRSNVHT